MKKSFYYLLCLLVYGPLYMYGQALETVDMSYFGVNANTYVTGINNEGYVCGYYNTGMSDIGFVITPNGRMKEFTPTGIGGGNCRVMGINDHAVAVVTKISGGVTEYYKCYFNINTEEAGPLVALQNVAQSTADPRGINNNNDISGRYNSNQYWLYVQHDSITPPGNTAWEANRVGGGSTWYQTYGAGINDANKVVGFYIDGVNYNSFVYDNLTGTFTQLASTYRVKPHDINNNGWVAGEFRQGAGEWLAFIANASGGNYSQWTSLNSIFHADVTYSVATGINDSNDVVGYFLHPVTNKYVGFIYHPGLAEYNLPDFDYSSTTWGLKNSKNGGIAVWPLPYYQNIDYYTTDPYFTNSSQPLHTTNLAIQMQDYYLPNTTSPTWRSFAEEVDTIGILTSTDPDIDAKYNNIVKPHWYRHWDIIKKDTFIGYCFGMTYSSLLKHFEDTTFAEMTNMPTGTNINAIANTDFDAIRSIERFNIKQFDGRMRRHPIEEYMAVGVWEGLYKLKNNFRKPFSLSNPSGIGLNFGNAASHSVFVYKIVTPQQLPFDYPVNKYDTLYIYDANRPNSTQQILKVKSSTYRMVHDSVSSPLYTDTLHLLKAISFNQPNIRSYADVGHTHLKTTSADGYDGEVRFSILRNSYYTINGNDTVQATVDNNGYTSNATPTDFRSIRSNEATGDIPLSYFMDTSYVVNVVSHNYADSAMVYLQSNRQRSMGISRHALPGEADHSSQKNRVITYGNPDNVTKHLNLFMTEFSNSLDEGVNIMATNVCAAQGDSIVTETLFPYTYTIAKVSGATACTYDLQVFSITNGSVYQFSAPIELSGNSAHTIDPYFDGPNGEQVAVITDNGMDGVTDDTLFVAGWPVGIKPMENSAGIKIYPNPVHDQLSIELPGNSEEYQIILAGITGQVVRTISAVSGKTLLPLASLPPGVYMLKIIDHAGRPVYRDKIIKQ